MLLSMPSAIQILPRSLTSSGCGYVTALGWAGGMVTNAVQIEGWQCPWEGHTPSSLLIPGSVFARQLTDTMTYPRSQFLNSRTRTRHRTSNFKFQVFLLYTVPKTSHVERWTWRSFRYFPDLWIWASRHTLVRLCYWISSTRLTTSHSQCFLPPLFSF